MTIEGSEREIPPTLDLGPGGTALFLDVDGTLVGFHAEPRAVAFDAALRRTVARLHRLLDGALAIVSGRRLADIDRLLAPLLLPVAGLHGAERRDAQGRLHRRDAAPALARHRAGLVAFAAEHPGVRLEDKGGAIALHYREAPAQGPAVRARIAAAAGDGLRAIDGNMVSELLGTAADKGQAIDAFMAEPPFRARRPVFLGDDVTDEDGFRAVGAAGGIAIRVGAADAATAASHRLPDVAAAVAWLGGLATAWEPTA